MKSKVITFRANKGQQKFLARYMTTVRKRYGRKTSLAKGLWAAIQLAEAHLADIMARERS